VGAACLVAGSNLVRWGNSSYASPDGLEPAVDGAKTAAAAALRRTRRPPRLAALTAYALVLDYLLKIQWYERRHTPPNDVQRREPWHRWWSGVEMPAGVETRRYSSFLGRGDCKVLERTFS
jgi:hypothetical protein